MSSYVVYANKRRLVQRARQVVTRGWCWVFGHEWDDPWLDDGVITERCVNACGASRLTWYDMVPRCECVPPGAEIGSAFVTLASCPAHGEHAEE